MHRYPDAHQVFDLAQDRACHFFLTAGEFFIFEGLKERKADLVHDLLRVKAKGLPFHLGVSLRYGWGEKGKEKCPKTVIRSASLVFPYEAAED